MSRSWISIALSGIVLVACGDGTGGDDGLTGFGPGTAGSADDAGPTSAGSGGAGGETTASAPTTAADGGTSTAGDEGPPPGEDTTGPVDPSAGSSGGRSDASDGPSVDGGELGDCLGTGAWQTCAQWCTASDLTCVEDGCDGATVVYYGDVDDCTAMASGQGASQTCDAGFQMGGGISFARCCCG